jgi:hypothetical protein
MGIRAEVSPQKVRHAQSIGGKLSMSKKIEVPQELLDKIIDCYVIKQYSLEKTLQYLNLPFGRNVLKRILNENNIHIRTYKEAASQGLHIPIPQDMVDCIIKLYNDGYSIERIQREIKQFFSSDKIKKVLKENNVPLRGIKEAAQTKIKIEERKYPVNDDYCLESHNGAWLLGFIAADGYLPITKGAKNRVVITLTRKDEEVLHRIAQEIKYEGPIYQYITPDKKSLVSSLAFTSRVLRVKMENYNIVNNKTFKLKHLPSLPQEFMIDFIRGYFDGDGSICKPKGRKISMCITSANKEFLLEIKDFLQKEYNIKSSIYNDHGAYNLRFFVKESLKLGKLFYENDYLSLQRKKNKYYEIITPTSLNTPQE